MERQTLALICSILLLVVLVGAGIIEQLPEKQKDIFLETSQYSYAGTFRIMIMGEEFKWVNDVKIIDRKVIITAKDLADRTYEECVLYDEEAELIGETPCLKYKNIIYPKDNINIKNIPITKEGGIYLTSISSIKVTGKDVITYSIKPDEHYIKIGDNSIIVIEDIITNADLVNITSESDFTHLNISNTAPYDSLVLYMPFDGDSENTATTTHYDFTKENNDGTGVGNAVVNETNCIYGDCLQLDGDHDKVDLGVFDSLDGMPNLTISAWVKWDGTTRANEECIVSGWAVGGLNYLFRWDSQTSKIEWYIYVDGTTQFGQGFANTDISDKAWHHLVAVYNSTDMLVYLDTVASTDTPSANGNITSTSDEIWIGASPHVGGANNGDSFDGTIDEVMIFNTSLTDSQITEIYNNQSSRFFATGTHGVTQNITLGFESVQVTGEYQSDIGSSINLSLGYYDGSWHQTSEQVYDGDNTFTITDTTTNLTLNFTYFAGSNNGNYAFYTPHLLGENGITLTFTYSCAYGSGNWNNNQYCEYTTANFNIGGNLTIFDDGTMNCTIGQCNLNFTETEQWMIFENVDDIENKLIGNWTINAP